MSQVFTSRWKALVWAAGIMLTAYCTIPSPEPDIGAATRSIDIAQARKQKGDAERLLQKLQKMQHRR